MGTTTKTTTTGSTTATTTTTTTTTTTVITDSVLISGGNSAPRSAEVYHPANGLSCRVPDLPDDRYYHTQDGALTCGGISYNGQAQLNNCLKWSPDSGTWTQSHTLPEPR